LEALRNNDTWNVNVNEADAIGVQIGIPLNDDSYGNRPKRDQALSKKSDNFVLSTNDKKITETTETCDDTFHNAYRNPFCVCIQVFFSTEHGFTINCRVLKCVSA